MLWERTFMQAFYVTFFPIDFCLLLLQFVIRFTFRPSRPDESKKLLIDDRSVVNFHIFFVVLCLFVWSFLFQFRKTPSLFLLLFILLFNIKYNQNDQSLHANDGNFASVTWSQYAPIVFFFVEWYMILVMMMVTLLRIPGKFAEWPFQASRFAAIY